MTLPELSAYLAGASLGLTVGTNLFMGPLPETPDAAVALLPYFGARSSEPLFGAADLVYEWPRLQVLVRGPVDDFAAADTVAQGCYRALGRVQAQALTGTFYHRVTCLQPPFLLRTDDTRRPILVFNVEAEKEVGS